MSSTNLDAQNGMPLPAYCLLDSLATKHAIEGVRELIETVRALPVIDLGKAPSSLTPWRLSRLPP
jgi:hypothetical protein